MNESSFLRSSIRVLALDVDGVLTDGRVILTPDGPERTSLSYRDLDAITQARDAGLKIAIVTGEAGPLVETIAARIRPDVLLDGAKDKESALAALQEQLDVTGPEICFVGDGDRDVPGLRMVGLALVPRDASPRARAAAHHVLSVDGGRGVAEAAWGHIRALESAMAFRPTLQRIVDESFNAHDRLRTESVPVLCNLAGMLCDAFGSGRKLLLCGNGGSAADAQHVAGEFVGGGLAGREPFPAIAITADSSVITAIGNDYEFYEVFARQVRALASPGDVVAGMSTSGDSENVLRAMEAAREMGAHTVGFTGDGDSRLAQAVELCFRAPSASTPRVQELHLLAWHALCEAVQRTMAKE